MANLTETATFEAGIYQLETTDPVQGGPGGIDNRQAQQLANRTLWLKQQQDATVQALGSYAPLASPMFTGDPRAPNPAQFDSDTSLATTAWAQANGIRASGVASFTGSATLTTAHAGGTVLVGGAGGATITLPPAGSFPPGGTITLVGSGVITSTNAIKGNGTEVIHGAFGNSTNTGTLRGLDVVTLMSDGTSSWRVISDGTSAFLERQFTANQLLASNGFQRFPGGLVLQQGNISITTGTATVTLPQAFTTEIYAMAAIGLTGADTVTAASCFIEAGRVSLSQIYLKVLRPTTSGTVLSDRGVSWWAIGK